MVRQAADQSGRYEIAFVDWQMPGMDGIETGKRILALPNLDPSPHLVMVTAYGREEVLKQAEETGFENVLIKPVTSSILFDTAVVALGADRERAETGAGRSLLRYRPHARRARAPCRGQRDQPGSRYRPARGRRGLRRSRRERRNRASHGQGQRLRRRAHGYADAGHGRHRGDAHLPRRPPLCDFAHHRHDRERHGV